MSNFQTASLGPLPAPSERADPLASLEAIRWKKLMEICMTCRGDQQQSIRPRSRRNAAVRGFSTIELVVVVGIAAVLGGMAIPVVQSSLRYFQLRSAVSAVTGAIQSTRYQAIFHGCTYSIAFSKANYTYTISSWAPPPGAAACLGAPVVGNPVPLPGAGGMTLNADATFTFSANGSVTPGGANAAAGIVLTQAHIQNPETIQVSNYGKTTVTP